MDFRPRCRLVACVVVFGWPTAAHASRLRTTPSSDAETAARQRRPRQVQPIDGTAESDRRPARFRLVPERSALLIEVRSSVGPISFGTAGITGSIEAEVIDGVLRTDVSPTGRLSIDVAGLNSGNKLYDAELLRRIDARRFRTITVELRECAASGTGTRYRLAGELTIHGVTRPAQGNVNVEALSDRRLVISGEQVFDIREFAIPSPTVLMLRIYPDVRVRLHAEAELEEAPRGNFS